MRLKMFAVSAAAVLLFALPAKKAEAQVSVGVAVGGPAPVCGYGYYDYAPYACAPYGYYGPEWFNGGLFIGAGPWYHGPGGFYGHVNRDYDPHFGYHGVAPGPNERYHEYGANEFHGNEYRNGRGEYRSEGEHAEFHGGGQHR